MVTLAGGDIYLEVVDGRAVPRIACLTRRNDASSRSRRRSAFRGDTARGGFLRDESTCGNLRM